MKIIHGAIARATLLTILLLGTFGCSENTPKVSMENLQNKIAKERKATTAEIKENRCQNGHLLFELIKIEDIEKFASQVEDYNCYLKESNLLGMSMFLDKPKMFEFLIDKVDEEKTLIPSIILAAKFRRLKYMKLFIQKGIDINTVSFIGNTLAMDATCSRQSKTVDSRLSILKFLSSNGLDITKSNYFGVTPLYCANSKSEVKYLISKGAKINVKSITNKTPLHSVESYEAAKELIKNGANVNTQENTQNHTPIFSAVKKASVEMVRVLLDNNADLSIKNTSGKTVLEFAREREFPNDEIIKLLENSSF